MPYIAGECVGGIEDTGLLYAEVVVRIGVPYEPGRTVEWNEWHVWIAWFGKHENVF